MTTTITGDGSAGVVVGDYTVPAAGDFVTGAGLQVTTQGLANDLQVAYSQIVPLGMRTITRHFRSEAFAFGSTSTWDFDFSNPSVWTDQTTPGTRGYICFRLDVPSHCILVGLTAEIVPAVGHGGLPTTKPRIALRKIAVSTNTVTETTATDAPANVAAYEAQHAFGMAPTATNTAWATSTAYVVGDFRTANSRLYMCIFAGTSSGAGTGPNEINGQAIVDGTCVWTYAGAVNGYVVDRATNRYSVQFGSEQDAGPNQLQGLQLVALRATYSQVLVGFGEQ